MPLQPSSVTSRSNNDLLTIKMIANNAYTSPEARMYAIAEVISGWTNAVADSTAYHGAQREYETRKANGVLYGEL